MLRYGQGKLADATMLSDMAVTTGSSLYSSEADNARRRSEDVCLLRVQQVCPAADSTPTSR